MVYSAIVEGDGPFRWICLCRLTPSSVSLYWLTNTGGSSAQLYYEGRAAWGQPQVRSTVPTGVAVFRDDFSIRRLVEREHSVVWWSEFERGGRFAAMEAPDLLVEDIRGFFRPLRAPARPPH